MKEYIENHQDDNVPDVYQAARQHVSQVRLTPVPLQGIEQEQAKLQKIKHKLDFIIEKGGYSIWA